MYSSSPGVDRTQLFNKRQNKLLVTTMRKNTTHVGILKETDKVGFSYLLQRLCVGLGRIRRFVTKGICVTVMAAVWNRRSVL